MTHDADGDGKLVRLATEACQDDPFVDDIPLNGTMQQRMRCEHYAKVALATRLEQPSMREALEEARECIVKFAETPCKYDYDKHNALCLIDAALSPQHKGEGR